MVRMRSEHERDMVFTALVSLLVSALMASFLPLLNMGWQPNLFGIWWKGFAVGMMISFLPSLRIIPLIHLFVTGAFVEARHGMFQGRESYIESMRFVGCIIQPIPKVK